MDGPYSIFVRDLQGRTVCLPATNSTSLCDLKASIEEITGLPREEQFIAGRHVVHEGCSLADQGVAADSTLHLTGRLRGGKGGFGSLLRGSGKTALTENEDACRDLSGRRLRLVNADKKLKDWAAAEKLRRDEKQAAKEERDKAKAESRAEEAQVDLDAIRKDQSAVIANVAKALATSRKNGAKRGAEEVKPTKPLPKRTRYSSDSEEESESDEEAAASDKSEAEVEVKELPAAQAIAVEVRDAANQSAKPAAPSASVGIQLAT